MASTRIGWLHQRSPGTKTRHFLYEKRRMMPRKHLLSTFFCASSWTRTLAGPPSFRTPTALPYPQARVALLSQRGPRSIPIRLRGLPSRIPAIMLRTTMDGGSKDGRRNPQYRRNRFATFDSVTIFSFVQIGAFVEKPRLAAYARVSISSTASSPCSSDAREAKFSATWSTPADEVSSFPAAADEPASAIFSCANSDQSRSVLLVDSGWTRCVRPLHL